MESVGVFASDEQKEARRILYRWQEAVSTDQSLLGVTRRRIERRSQAAQYDEEADTVAEYLQSCATALIKPEHHAVALSHIACLMADKSVILSFARDAATQVLSVWNDTIRYNDKGPQIMLERVLYLTVQGYLTEKMGEQRVGTIASVIGELTEIDPPLPEEHIWTVCQWTRSLADDCGNGALLGNREIAESLRRYLETAIGAEKEDDDLIDEASKREENQQKLRRTFTTSPSKDSSAYIDAIWAGITEGCREMRESVRLPKAIDSLSDIKLYSLMSCDNTGLYSEAFEYFSSKCLASLEDLYRRDVRLETGACVYSYAKNVESLFKEGESPAALAERESSWSESDEVRRKEMAEAILKEDIEDMRVTTGTTAREMFEPGVIRFIYGRKSSS